MTTYHWSFLEDVTAYRAAGIEGIGVWRRKLQDFGEERGADLLRESGMRVSSLSFAGGFTGAHGHSFRDAVRDGLDALRLAIDIQAECLVVVSGTRAGHTLNHARELFCDALLHLGDEAARHGIQIAIHPMQQMSGQRWTFLTSLDATLDVLGRCRHPQVGMVFDVYHMWREPDLCRRIPEIIQWIKTVGMSDWRQPHPHLENDRCLPGAGCIPLAEILGALYSAGYNGYYDMQILSDEHWNSDYGCLLQNCQNAFRSICAAALDQKT